MTDVAGGVELAIATDQTITIEGLSKADFDRARSDVFNITGTPEPGPNPAGNLLETAGPNFNTLNGFNIVGSTTVTGDADEITVVDPAHLNGSVLDGGGGTDSVTLDGPGNATFDLGLLNAIAGMENLTLAGGDDLRAGQTELSAFDTITSENNGIFLPQGDVDTSGPGPNSAGSRCCSSMDHRRRLHSTTPNYPH